MPVEDAEQPLIDDLNATQRVTWGEFLKPFILLGWAAFGTSCVDLGQRCRLQPRRWPHGAYWLLSKGVQYHVVISKTRRLTQLFVERYRWLTSGIFVELLALGQCLPGPTSTQMAFAIGVSKKGVTGGLTSGACRHMMRGQPHPATHHL